MPACGKWYSTEIVSQCPGKVLQDNAATGNGFFPGVGDRGKITAHDYEIGLGSCQVSSSGHSKRSICKAEYGCIVKSVSYHGNHGVLVLKLLHSLHFLLRFQTNMNIVNAQLSGEQRALRRTIASQQANLQTTVGQAYRTLFGNTLVSSRRVSEAGKRVMIYELDEEVLQKNRDLFDLRQPKQPEPEDS